MDPRQLEALAQRLAANPNDTDALNAAYAHGQTDPRGYAVFLENTGAASPDPATGAHWFCEAANVWTTSLNDHHRAERALTKAVERDPLHTGATERLVNLYREKGNTKALLTLHQRRAKILEKGIADRPDLRLGLAEIHGEVARVFTEDLGQPEKAISAYQKAAEFNPSDAFSIYQARELLKAAGRLKEALPLYQAEIDLIADDPVRQVALYADEAAVCRELGDKEGLKRSLRGARSVDPNDDPGLKQQLAAVVLEEVQTGTKVSDADRGEAEALFVSLAETYDGEYGHSYAVCALGLNPKNDRAAQLAMYYGQQIGKAIETAPTIAQYLAANPNGLVAQDARQIVAAALEAGGGDELIAALTPAPDASPADQAAAFGLIGRSLMAQGRRPAALDYFVRVIGHAPNDTEAVSVLADEYRSKDPQALRDLLLGAVQTPDLDTSQRHLWLSELAATCEGPLGDVEGAIYARKELVQLNPSDEEAADQLETILATAAKWDDLAALIARRAQSPGDPQVQLERELRVADIHLTRRRDRLAAAEALERAARIEPDETERTFSAVDLYVEVDRAESAIALLIALLSQMLDSEVRVSYSERLAGLLEDAGRLTDAGGAYAEAASGSSDPALWGESERCFAAAEAWSEAARAVAERTALLGDDKERSHLCAVRAAYLNRLGDSEGVLQALREALEFDPRNHRVSGQLQKIFETEGRYGELVTLLLRRAEFETNGEERATVRKRAGFLQRDHLQDEEGMRQALLLVLDDVEDPEALAVLADDAERNERTGDAIAFLRRLAEVSTEESRIEIALRLSRLLEESGDEEGALEQYEMVLVHHPERRDVLGAVAQLRRSLGNNNGAAEAYSRLVEVSEGEQKLSAARIWAEILAELGQKKAALGAYAIVLSIDPEDYEVVEQARDLAEEADEWQDYVKYQQELVDLEGDEDEASEMVRKLAEVYELKLESPKDAMRVLTPFVKRAETACRHEFERLGKDLGSELETAELVFKWMKDLSSSDRRTAALKDAYQVFFDHKADAAAIEAGLELVSMKGAEEDLARSLEVVGSRAKHLDALRTAFRVVGSELSGPARAEEMVRQAEVLHKGGATPSDSVQHGEQALSSAAPEEVEPLLQRLATIAGTGDEAVAVYERQVSRCKSTPDRLRALCRGAEVAHDQGVIPRVGQFLELAIQTAGHGDGLDDLRMLLADMDRAADRKVLREAFCRTLSESGKSARDAGKSRAEYLSHAAAIAYEDLEDAKMAFSLMTQALIAHASEDYLRQLVEMGEQEDDLGRAAGAITIALEHVSDSPMVRLLLRCRFDLYSGPLDQQNDATEDLKRLYDLSPTESDIAEQLEQRYDAADDHRGLVKLYEDRILRGRDKKERAELARKVAVIWQDTLNEPREAADAWRRVLRMNSGDTEAKDGLEQAKAAMRRVSVKQVIEGEEQTRKEVEAQREIEAAEAKRRLEELEAKAAELKARHSQPPPSVEEIEEESEDKEVLPVDVPLPGDLEALALVEATRTELEASEDEASTSAESAESDASESDESSSAESAESDASEDEESSSDDTEDSEDVGLAEDGGAPEEEFDDQEESEDEDSESAEAAAVTAQPFAAKSSVPPPLAGSALSSQPPPLPPEASAQSEPPLGRTSVPPPLPQEAQTQSQPVLAALSEEEAAQAVLLDEDAPMLDDLVEDLPDDADEDEEDESEDEVKAGTAAESADQGSKDSEDDEPGTEAAQAEDTEGDEADENEDDESESEDDSVVRDQTLDRDEPEDGAAADESAGDASEEEPEGSAAADESDDDESDADESAGDASEEEPEGSAADDESDDDESEEDEAEIAVDEVEEAAARPPGPPPSRSGVSMPPPLPPRGAVPPGLGTSLPPPPPPRLSRAPASGVNPSVPLPGSLPPPPPPANLGRRPPPPPTAAAGGLPATPPGGSRRPPPPPRKK